jgi:Spx/MgsR family transcriptional regulator
LESNLSQHHSITIYGIPNCQSVKKARTWVEEQGLTYEFHDFKKQGVPLSHLKRWVQSKGWEVVLNKKGTTWRQLPADEQSRVLDASSAISAMSKYPSLIKRPIIEIGDSNLEIGVNPQAWANVML